MTNLFSSFSPLSWFSLPLNWSSCVVGLALLPGQFWSSPTQVNTLLLKPLLGVHRELRANFSQTSIPGTTLIPLSLFLVILVNNSLGLTPYTFTATSHLMFTASLALPLWLGHMTLAVLKTPSSCAAHCVPLGTPALLAPLMVLIELISSLIRPMTLCVRLAANMVAGHLLLTLLGNSGPSSPHPLLVVILGSAILLMTLEVGVSIIQSYVFSMLSTLYLAEVDSPPLN